ncbi:MAG: hypothetical protein ABI361_05920 [Nitrososphaera sp.]|jgi:flagellar basal body-associated protein FliL
MGIVTWIIVAVVVLAILGLGIGTFFSGVFKGAQTVGQNPVVKNATQEAKQFVTNNITGSISKQIANRTP